MPTLIIEDGGPRRGGTFNGPLLVGRRPANAVIIDDPTVSHVHAWIGQRNGSFFVSNIASRGHTLVNGELVLGRRKLIDGDRIELGKNTKLTYLEGHDLPRGLTSVELTWRGPMIEDPDIPVVFACQCGATMSITPVFSGSVAKCQFCERMIVVPHPQPPTKKKELEPASPPDTLGNAGDTTDGFGIEWHRFAPGGISTAPLKLSPNPTAAPASPGAVPTATAAVAISPPRSAAPPKVPVPKAPEPVARVEPAPAPVPVVEKKLEPPPAPIVEKKIELPPAPAPIIEKKPQPIPSTPAPAPVVERKPEPPPARVSLFERKPEPAAAPPARPQPVAPKPDSIGRCGVCHTDILAGESLTRCSGCSSTFHTDCWVANYGCSSYGCINVNSLKPDKEEVDPEAEAALAAAKEADRFPWEFLLLGGSVASFILGVLAWGIPSIIVAFAAVFMTIRRGPKRVGILATAGAVAILGLLVGLEVSALWWLGRPLDLVRR